VPNAHPAGQKRYDAPERAATVEAGFLRAILGSILQRQFQIDPSEILLDHLEAYMAAGEWNEPAL
jgi:hypothetical protein